MMPCVVSPALRPSAVCLVDTFLCILMFVGVYLDNARGYEPRVKEIIFCTELYSSLETVSASASSFSEALKMTKEEVETLPTFAQQLRRNYTVTVFTMSP